MRYTVSIFFFKIAASQIGVKELYDDCLKIGDEILLDLIKPLTKTLV